MDSGISLIWSLLGLEALYGKGSTGLKEQLVGKTEAFLGERTENKKRFGAMYDFRSRFIHGNIDIPFRYSPYDAISEFQEFHSDLYSRGQIALAALIATLQRMAANGWYDLRFAYSVHGE